MRECVVGVDEAGRGPLAGPVVAACVALREDVAIPLKDSKKLTALQRDKLARDIYACADSVGVGICEPDEIDSLNIHHATLLAMQKAIDNLNFQPQHIWIDGLFVPVAVSTFSSAIVKGDQKVPAIMAASIIAKTTRDKMMIDYCKVYPNYGFEKHKGYGTRLHLEALRNHGITPIHRKSFQPIKSMNEQI